MLPVLAKVASALLSSSLDQDEAALRIGSLGSGGEAATVAAVTSSLAYLRDRVRVLDVSLNQIQASLSYAIPTAQQANHTFVLFPTPRNLKKRFNEGVCGNIGRVPLSGESRSRSLQLLRSSRNQVGVP